MGNDRRREAHERGSRGPILPGRSAATDRARFLRLAVWLVGVNLIYNVVEGVLAIWWGSTADSSALVAFGLDSGIETVAAGVALWRILSEKGSDQGSTERQEFLAHRLIGWTFIVFASYVVVDAVWALLAKELPQESLLGIILASVSLVVMPALSWAKLRVARRLGSRALQAEALETLACSYLSATLLIGLGAHAVLGWWWADPAAAMLMVPWLIREGWEGVSTQMKTERKNSAETHTPAATNHRNMNEMSTSIAKPAKVAIIGASGTYGKGILARAEEIGIDAVVITRSPHKFKDVKPTTTVVEAQLNEEEKLKEAFAGCDGVISALGDDRKTRPKTHNLPHVWSAMKAAGVTKYIGMGSGAMMMPSEKPGGFQRTVYPLLSILKLFGVDLLEQNEWERDSLLTGENGADGITWVLTRPVRPTRAPFVGADVHEDRRGPLNCSIYDHGDFCLYCVASSEWDKLAPHVSSGSQPKKNK